MKRPDDVSRHLLGKSYDELDRLSQNVTRQIAAHGTVARNTAREQDDDTTFGQRAADRVASFGGSWTFIIIFAVVLVAWVVLNGVLLAFRGSTFDPYPYILLNLFLSMLASIQAPIMLMSQNRQAQKDRYSAEHDYEVNLKAELEIMLLHEKVDALRDGQWRELIDIQKQQLTLLSALMAQQPGLSPELSPASQPGLSPEPPPVSTAS